MTVDGEDYRHRGLAPSPEPLSDDEVAARVRRRRWRRSTASTTCSPTSRRCTPAGTARCSTASTPWAGTGVHPIADQNVALRLVVLADRLYDRDVPVFASGTPLGELFTPD